MTFLIPRRERLAKSLCHVMSWSDWDSLSFAMQDEWLTRADALIKESDVLFDVRPLLDTLRDMKPTTNIHNLKQNDQQLREAEIERIARRRAINDVIDVITDALK